jgi:hypothetical protein
VSNFLRSTVSAAALAVVAAGATPAMAQTALLADVSIEGPIQGFEAAASGDVAPNGQPIIGVMKVMGATIKVPANAAIHTPTNGSLTWAQFTTGAFPGRGEPGFLGGTAIVTGDSQGGVIYATDVFSDLSENVVVGEATASVVDGPANRATVNDIPLVPLDDPRMPAGRPINGFGFEVNPTQIIAGTLVSVEGYYAAGKLNYHTFEADGATLVKPTTAEVSVLRAQCRIRGRGRDELEVRGGTKNPANARVTIQYLQANGVTWTSLAPTVVPVVDTTVAPQQGLYRYVSSSLRFAGGVCPAQIRAIFTANAGVASDGFTPDAR